MWYLEAQGAPMEITASFDLTDLIRLATEAWDKVRNG